MSIACVFAVTLFGPLEHAAAASLTLAWDHSTDSNTAGYRVSYGTQSGSHTTSVTAGYVSSVNLANLTAGTTYYFVVQSYDSRGLLGPPSPEIAALVPQAQPALMVSCPSPVLTSADGKAMPVTLTPTVNGGVAPVTTACSPASGSLFPIGQTSFTCTAVDAGQRKASCTSIVTVLAPTPPPAPAFAITCPAIPVATASGNSGKTTVRFGDPQVSGGTSPVTVTCTPRSGSQFSVGTTTVSCQATDAVRQTAACTTSVTVQGR